jgi:hypothetical protein
MKILPAIAACCAALLAGCDSGIGDSVRSALQPREEPRTQVFQADQKAAYEAARAAAKSMGYRYVKGGPAQGELEELSGISRDETGSSRQMSMRVRLSPETEGGTAVTVSFDEIVEADSTGQGSLGTETPVRAMPLYETFFRRVQEAILAPSKEP